MSLLFTYTVEKSPLAKAELLDGKLLFFTNVKGRAPTDCRIDPRPCRAALQSPDRLPDDAPEIEISQ